MLDTVHHQGIRLSLGAFRTSPVESLYVEANEVIIQAQRTTVIAICNKAEQHPKQSNILQTKIF